VLAHELRTPLSAIFNSLEVMRQRQSDHAGAEWAQSLLERQARHMERLIGELLDASRIERGKIMLYKQTMDLIPAVVDAVETVSALIEERGHELDVILPPEAIYVEADPTRLQQIISNLLTNAAKYTEAHGAICVVVERNAREAVLRVRDNGAGLAPEIVPLLFEPFVQAKNGSQGGLGIGLHLVKGLVRLHGGSIAATSNGIGQGSEFIVRLPRADGCRSREPESGQIAELGCPALRT
jgi:signal transduction histidine kinase